MTVFVISAGTQVAVSQSGRPFEPHVLKAQFQFDAPMLTSDTTMTFTKGDRRIMVDRDKVIMSSFNGQGGANQFGA